MVNGIRMRGANSGDPCRSATRLSIRIFVESPIERNRVLGLQLAIVAPVMGPIDTRFGSDPSSSAPPD
jgi:hypothetical protein